MNTCHVCFFFCLHKTPVQIKFITLGQITLAWHRRLAFTPYTHVPIRKVILYGCPPPKVQSPNCHMQTYLGATNKSLIVCNSIDICLGYSDLIYVGWRLQEWKHWLAVVQILSTHFQCTSGHCHTYANMEKLSWLKSVTSMWKKYFRWTSEKVLCDLFLETKFNTDYSFHPQWTWLGDRLIATICRSF